MRILLINNYDSYADLLAYALWCAGGTRPTVVYNDATHVDAIVRGGYDRIVLSPGPGHPGEARDFGVCADVIASVRVPLLGVCLGHQGIAMVAGGRLKLAPEIKHGKRSVIVHDNHPFFAGVPNRFMAMRYHSWVVDRAALPDGVQVLAHAQDDGAVMALTLRDRPVLGVQFHPESVGTPAGRRMLLNFLQGTTRAGPCHPSAAPRPRPRSAQVGKTPSPGRGRKQTLPPARDAPQPSSAHISAQSPEHLAFAELPWRDPEQVFARHFARKSYAFWLDSATPSRRQRWSIMGTAQSVLQMRGERVVRVTTRGVEVLSRDFWSALRQTLGAPQRGAADLPCPFAGGLVGYLGYELQRQAQDAVATPGAGSHDARPCGPQSLMQQCRRFLAFDHLARKVYAVSSRPDDEHVDPWLERVRAAWRSPLPPLESLDIRGHSPPHTYWPPQVHAHIDRAGYMRRIAEAQAHIRLGNIYEVCLSNRFDAPGRIDPWHLYRILRHTHPAPYAAFLKGPSSSILSVSPERFLTLDNDGTITTEPIKGTRAHCGSVGSLAFQRRALRHSPKDQAELLMIVDLLRNDLARVARRGSVRVPELFRVRDHATLVQMSAMITAKLRKGCDAVDLLHACFPCGSITGAPKRRAMEILAALEDRPRGAFTGAIGYLSSSGTMNFNVAIRTLEHHASGVSFGAGGAITADSDPHGECDEVLAKAFALARAIALAQDGPGGELSAKDAIQGGQ